MNALYVMCKIREKIGAAFMLKYKNINCNMIGDSWTSGGAEDQIQTIII